MAGSRGESWWQPPKDFDARAGTGTDTEELPEEVEEVAEVEAVDWDEPEPEPEPEPEAEQIEPPTADWDGDDHDDEPDDPLEVPLEDDRPIVSAGWTSPTGDVIPHETGNRRFYIGVVMILVATAIGVVIALGLGSDGGGDESLEPTATTVALDVRGATTIRPGGLSPVCQAEQDRVQQAEEDYRRGSVNNQYTDMTGLVGTGKLAAPSTLFVVTNEVVGDPSEVSFAGNTAKEFEDYLVLPIPDGPCDTT